MSFTQKHESFIKYNRRTGRYVVFKKLPTGRLSIVGSASSHSGAESIKAGNSPKEFDGKKEEGLFTRIVKALQQLQID